MLGNSSAEHAKSHPCRQPARSPISRARRFRTPTNLLARIFRKITRNRRAEDRPPLPFVTSAQKPFHPPNQSRFAFRRQFMLPNAKHAPARSAEGSIYQNVTGFGSAQLLSPESAVGCRLCGVERTAVPETAVHKHRQPLLPKDEVGLSEEGLMPPPTGQAAAAQQ